jgi:hypothetical protein
MALSRLEVGWAAAAALMLAPACVDSSEPPTADNIGQKFAETLCAAKKRCCEAQGAPLSDALVGACTARESLVPAEASAFTANQVFNADIAQECIKAAARFDCTNGGLIAQICYLVFSGHTPLGGACTVDSDCEQASGAHAFCEGAPGTCVAAKLFQGVGAACPHEDDTECDLVNGIWCDYGASSTDGVCAAPMKAGDSCADVTAICPLGTDCTGIAPQVCRPQQPLGAACDSNGYFPCLPPGLCTNGTCVSNGSCVANDPS